MTSLSCKPNADQVIERLRSLYDRRAEDRIFASFAAPSETLREFRRQHAAGACEYTPPLERMRFWDALLRESAALADDSIPCAYLSEFDQGLYGGLVGGRVQFMCDPDTGWISSMVMPLLSSLSQIDSLEIDESHPWFERCLTQLEVFSDRSRGKFGVSHFILIDGLNFVFELVGGFQTYEGLFDSPELIRRAVDFAFDLNVKVQETFFDLVPLLDGGTCSNMAQWLPGRIVSESVDPFHMTSVDYFETWGREPVERILAHFDGGVMHLHGNGRHLLEAVASIEGLKALFLADDTGFPLSFDVLTELRSRAPDLPLVVSAQFEPFRQRLKQHTLPGGVFYKILDAPSVDAANLCMEEVRAYRL